MTFDSASDAASFSHDEPPTLIRRRPATLEKRAAARLPIEMDVSVEGAAQRFTATSGDLSSGGMFLITPRAIPVGQTYGAADDPVTGAPRSAGLGLVFFCLAPEVKTLLEGFCSARELLYYQPS